MIADVVARSATRNQTVAGKSCHHLRLSVLSLTGCEGANLSLVILVVGVTRTAGSLNFLPAGTEAVYPRGQNLSVSLEATPPSLKKPLRVWLLAKIKKMRADRAWVLAKYTGRKEVQSYAKKRKQCK